VLLGVTGNGADQLLLARAVVCTCAPQRQVLWRPSAIRPDAAARFERVQVRVAQEGIAAAIALDQRVPVRRVDCAEVVDRPDAIIRAAHAPCPAIFTR